MFITEVRCLLARCAMSMRLMAQGVACCAPTGPHHSVEKG